MLVEEKGVPLNHWNILLEQGMRGLHELPHNA
jgi:hypothetical protein